MERADPGLVLDYYRRAAELAVPQWKRQGKSHHYVVQIFVDHAIIK